MALYLRPSRKSLDLICADRFGHTLSLRNQLFSTSATKRRISQPRADVKAKGPLAGIRILDLSRILAGPFCTQILADYGADVVKVEQPRTGDDTRFWQIAGEEARWRNLPPDSPTSFYFNAINRNKRSITLDLKKPSALNVLYELARVSDVFVQNFIPGKAEQLGLGYERLKQENPGLVYASLSGYGMTGPYSRRAGYDAIAAAEGGLMHITGEAGRPPVRPGLGMVDMSTGLYLHGAIIAAIRARDLTGRGQSVDASLFETQLSLLTNIATNWLNMGVEGQRYGTAHPSIVPYNTYKSKDGYFALGANNERQWKTFCERLGRMEWHEDPRFKNNSLRVANRQELDRAVEEMVKTKTNDEWLAVLEGSGLACGPVNSIEKVFEHAQAKARGMVIEMDHENLDRPMKMVRPAVKFSETDPAIRTRAPLLGEHTVEVLQELGYDGDKIEELRKEGAI